jgi:hypothetical protein
MKKPITHSYRTQLLIFTGLVGFILGVFFMFNPGNEYHDVVFQPRTIVDTLLARKQQELFPSPPDPDSMLLAISALRKINRYDELDTAWPRDFGKLERPRPLYGIRQKFYSYLLYLRLAQERRRVEDLADTSVWKRYFVGSLFTADKATLARIYSNPDTAAASRTFRFRYDHDTTFPELNIHAESEITLSTRTYPATGLAFFIKYPNFGTFAALMIFQFVAFFIIIPLSFGTINDLRAAYKTTPRPVWTAFILATGVVIAYAGMILLFIVKPDYISDKFFMKGFTTIVGLYYALAYLTAIPCYAGYLFTARLIGDKIKEFEQPAVAQRDNLVKREALRKAAPLAATEAATAPATTFTASLAANAKDITASAKTISALADDYKKLRSHFTIFFYTSAFLLSMIVLATGSLFSAIGSLDLMRFLNLPPSYTFVRNDFVYLLGGLYSILLLIFYVPVKISLINLESQLPDTTIPGTDENTWLPVFSSGLRTTASVLAASSPFLISIIQYILQSLGGSN